MDKRTKFQVADNFKPLEQKKSVKLCNETFMRENYASNICEYDNDNRIPRPSEQDYRLK